MHGDGSQFWKRGRLPRRVPSERVRGRAVARAATGAVAVVLAAGLTMLTGPAGASPRSPSGHRKLSPPTILQTGELQFCSTIATPPVEYYTSSHVPTGTDVELGSAIAKQLGLKPV